MKKIDRFWHSMDRLEESLRAPSYKSSKPRVLDDDDFDRMETAANARRSPSKSQQSMLQRMKFTHPYRVASIQSDMRWLKRYLKKNGYNPEDYRDYV